MKFSDILDMDFVLSYDESLQTEIDLTPTTKPEEVTKHSALFIYKRTDGTPSVSAVDLSSYPAVIVCEAGMETELDGISVVTVSSARRAFAYACYIHFLGDLSIMKIIGITGTNGKTTTATLLYEILRKSGHSCGFIGTGSIRFNDEVMNTVNYSMTTPDPDVLYNMLHVMKKRGVEYIVMEVSSHALSLEKLAPLHFNLAVMTNLSREHMDYHKDMWDYLMAKETLFGMSDKAIFNIDDYYTRIAYYRARCEKISVGAIQSADVSIRDVKLSGLEGSEFIYKGSGAMFRVKSPLPGYYNIYNSALALASAISLGVKPCNARRAIESVLFIPGRCQILKEDVTVIIDYAHTPYAMENLLKFANSCIIPKQNIITIFGCGGKRDKNKRREMTDIALRLSNKVIITEDNTRGENFTEILTDMVGDVNRDDKIVVIQKRREAIRTAILSASSGDIILLVGKGCESYMIDADGYHEYSELKEATDALRIRGAMRNED